MAFGERKIAKDAILKPRQQTHYYHPKSAITRRRKPKLWFLLLALATSALVLGANTGFADTGTEPLEQHEALLAASMGACGIWLASFAFILAILIKRMRDAN